jgi:hypothetical protein
MASLRNRRTTYGMRGTSDSDGDSVEAEATPAPFAGREAGDGPRVPATRSVVDGLTCPSFVEPVDSGKWLLDSLEELDGLGPVSWRSGRFLGWRSIYRQISGPRASVVSVWLCTGVAAWEVRSVNPQVPGSSPGRGAKILNELRPVLAAGSFRKKPVVLQFFGQLVGVTLWPARYLTYVSLICRSA